MPATSSRENLRSLLERCGAPTFDNLGQHIRDLKEYRERVERECTFCHRMSAGALPYCSRCKSVRYCGQNCQSAHYKAGHKRECAAFAKPPFTTAFVTQPVGDMKYPTNPVFGHAHDGEGMGCWVSRGGSIDGGLQRLVEEMDVPSPTAFHNRRGTVERNLETAGKHKAYRANLLTVAVLVQNRRKDGQAMFVFGARTQLVTYANTLADIMRGQAAVDRTATFEAQGLTLGVVGVAEDPWTKAPRLTIQNVNGQNVNMVPTAVRDARLGIVALKPGDFAVFHMQFRVGDGNTIDKEWLGFRPVSTLCLAIAPCWDSMPYMELDRALADSFGCGEAPEGLRVDLNYAVIRGYYEDAITKGEDAYVESHFGAERAAMLRMVECVEAASGKEMFEMYEENGELAEMAERFRVAGLEEAAEWMESPLMS